jgi:hypothetical protein
MNRREDAPIAEFSMLDILNQILSKYGLIILVLVLLLAFVSFFCGS